MGGLHGYTPFSFLPSSLYVIIPMNYVQRNLVKSGGLPAVGRTCSIVGLKVQIFYEIL